MRYSRDRLAAEQQEMQRRQLKKMHRQRATEQRRYTRLRAALQEMRDELSKTGRVSYPYLRSRLDDVTSMNR